MKRLFILFGVLAFLIFGSAQWAGANIDPNPGLGNDCLHGHLGDCPIPDPLVHVCIDGQVQTVLTSVAVASHLDILGADQGCPVTTTTTAPPVTVTTLPDPLVHVCVNGEVQSMLASVAANLHLDILGSDTGCQPVTTTTVPPTTVVTVPEAPHVTCTLPGGTEVKTDVGFTCPTETTSGPGTVVAPPTVTQPATPVEGPVAGTTPTSLTQLPHTGMSEWLAVLGFSLLCLGGSVLATEKLLRRVSLPPDLARGSRLDAG